MRKLTTRSGLFLAGALVVGLAGAGAASAHQDAALGAATTRTPGEVRVSATPLPPTSVEHQQGIVMEGSGDSGGLEVMATLYENSLHGSSLQVVIGDPELDQIGFVEQAEPFVVDGALSVEVEVLGKTATLSGTVAESGARTKVIEPRQDAGEQIVVRGTHTQLVTDVILTYDGAEVPLEFAPAFAFDLEVRDTALYGN